MTGIFDATTIKGMRLRNRLVRSATWEGLGDEQGAVTDAVETIYDALGKGEVGLVISSYLYVTPAGQQLPGQLGAHHDDMVAGLARLAAAVHRHGGVIAGQIVHCGGQADRKHNGGLDPQAPSAVQDRGYGELPRELTTGQVEALIEEHFPAAARRVKDAGFDAVQLHGAHGYLLSQFLSPSRNQRRDRFGGDRAGRMRFTIEVVSAVRKAVGPDFPVMIKLNANDFMAGSTTEADSTALAAALAEAGIDAIEVSGGTPGSGRLGPVRVNIQSQQHEAYFLPQAKAIREAATGVPLMLVGGLRSVEKIEAILAAGEADYLSMARPLIGEPELPARWQSGDRARALCESCTKCFIHALKGGGIRCTRLEQDG